MSALQELLGRVAFPDTPEERDDAENAIREMIESRQARLDRVEALAEYPSNLTPEAAQLLRAALDPAA